MLIPSYRAMPDKARTGSLTCLVLGDEHERDSCVLHDTPGYDPQCTS